MSPAELLAVSLALAMDAVAVSLALGLQGRPGWRAAGLTALMFGGFQALMPLAGWALSYGFAGAVSAYAPWLAFGLLSLVGAHMIREGFTVERSAPITVTFVSLLPLAVATSIDAASVGVTFAFLDVAVLPAASVIGVVTAVLSLVALEVGSRASEHLGRWAAIAGGVLLVLIGLSLLVEHLR